MFPWVQIEVVGSSNNLENLLRTVNNEWNSYDPNRPAKRLKTDVDKVSEIRICHTVLVPMGGDACCSAPRDFIIALSFFWQWGAMDTQ